MIGGVTRSHPDETPSPRLLPPTRTGEPAHVAGETFAYGAGPHGHNGNANPYVGPTQELETVTVGTIAPPLANVTLH